MIRKVNGSIGILCIRNTVLLWIAFLSNVSAGIDTPSYLQGARVISATEAYKLVDKGILLVDSRVALEYVEQHIRGAVSIPYKEKSAKSIDFDPTVDRFNVSQLPTDKDAPVIIYCNSGSCWKSYKACIAAIKAGHKNIYWLRGGIPEWKEHGFPVE